MFNVIPEIRGIILCDNFVVASHLYYDLGYVDIYHSFQVIETHTVEWLYNTIQYNMILHTSLTERRQNIKVWTHKINPMSFVSSLEKIDRVITAPHCISEHALVISNVFTKHLNSLVNDITSFWKLQPELLLFHSRILINVLPNLHCVLQARHNKDIIARQPAGISRSLPPISPGM